VIIPAYRAAHTIGRAVDSVFAQTHRPDEILIIDDGSPDDLGSALQPYGNAIRLIRQANGGAASARNLGIDEAQGDLVAFLDADDTWEPAKLERQVDVFHRHPNVFLVASRYFNQVPGDQREVEEEDPEVFADRVQSFSGEKAFYVVTRVWTTTVAVRREALGNNRFDCTLSSAEDRDLWVRLVRSGPIYLIGEPLATAILEPGSLSRSNLDVAWSNMLRVVHRNKALLGPRGVRKWERAAYRNWAACQLANGQAQAALGPACRRLQRQPLSPEAWWILLKSAFFACAPKRAHPPSLDNHNEKSLAVG
jgi:glycosyltransferase involved in cell wall biosynthesis